MKLKRSKQNLSHEWKGTMRMGQLVPILCQEVLPGDWFKDQTNIVIKVSPLLAPIMHEVKAYTHFFFVPNRLVWDKWEDFITGGKDGQDSSVAPYITAPENGFALGSLADYLGYETGVAGYTASALPFRCYALIYNQWYRDEFLQNELAISTLSGSDTTTSLDLKNRNWEKDRFTASRLTPQLGATTYLPMLTSADVVVDDKTKPTSLVAERSDHYMIYTNVGMDGYGNLYGTAGGAEAQGGEKTNLRADLAQATQVSIDDVNLGFQIQRWKQLNNIKGVRYIESILAHFNTRISDYKVGRSIFLGGGVSPLIVSDVLQTSSTDATSPQANMAGHAFSAQRTHQFKHMFEEHGWIIGILSVMPKSNYCSGLPRKFTRTTRYDYAWPIFSHLGEQAILSKELLVTGTSSTDNAVFGYEPRYNEYRHELSTVHGDFKDTLDYWHMGRKFSEAPTLSSEFVTCTPTQRINAVTDSDNLRVWVGHELYAVRPLPKYGIPKIGG